MELVLDKDGMITPQPINWKKATRKRKSSAVLHALLLLPNGIFQRQLTLFCHDQSCLFFHQ